MIEPFTTEQYLPCNEPELYGVDKRRKLPHENISIGLSNDFSLLPMYRGGMLITPNGLFYVDDDAIALLQELVHCPNVNGIVTNPDREYELERFNYYGILAFNPDKCGRVSSHVVPEEIRELYDSGDFGWFSYYPTRVELDLSNLCNFECIHCSREASPFVFTEEELGLDAIKRIISEAAELGVYSFQLMGGEPLIYRHFFDVCEYAKREGVKHLDTSTNGWAINAEVAQTLAQYFYEIQISIHGARENTHDAIVRKKGAWRRISEAAKALTDAGVLVRFNFTVMEQNVDEIELMPKVAKDLGATSLRFLVLSNEGRGINLRSWTNEERALLGSRIKALFLQEQEDGGSLEIECGGFPALAPLNNKAQFYGCPAGRELLYINANGSVSCCGAVEEHVGNIREHSIMQLWHHPKMVELRKPQACNCDYKYMCSGPCVADFERSYEDKISFA